MSARHNFRTRGNRQWLRLLVFASFIVVLALCTRPALAARVPAPMCTPDAQSMPAPLQRTATSVAEIRRGACLSVQGPSWDILPERPSLPVNWYDFVGDPLWLAATSIRAFKGKAILLPQMQAESADRQELTGEVFRPPKCGNWI